MKLLSLPPPGIHCSQPFTPTEKVDPPFEPMQPGEGNPWEHIPSTSTALSALLRGKPSKARLEVSLQKKLLTKAHTLFFKGLKETKGDASEVRTFCGNSRYPSMLGERGGGGVAAAKYTREGEGRAGRRLDHQRPCGVSDVYRFQ